jgi:hypothetical protein
MDYARFHTTTYDMEYTPGKLAHQLPRYPEFLLSCGVWLRPLVSSDGRVAGRDFPCWTMKAVMVPFCFNIHLVTLLRSMKVLLLYTNTLQHRVA